MLIDNINMMVIDQMYQIIVNDERNNFLIKHFFPKSNMYLRFFVSFFFIIKFDKKSSCFICQNLPLNSQNSSCLDNQYEKSNIWNLKS